MAGNTGGLGLGAHMPWARARSHHLSSVQLQVIQGRHSREAPAVTEPSGRSPAYGAPSSSPLPRSRLWIRGLTFVLSHLCQLRKHRTFQSPVKSCRPSLPVHHSHCPPWGNKRGLPPPAWAPGSAQSFTSQMPVPIILHACLEWCQPALSMFPWGEVTVPQRNNPACYSTSLYSV